MTAGQVEVEGTPPTITRFRSGLLTADMALADLRNNHWGFPERSIYEIYGKPETGKNTLSYYLAGKNAPSGRVLYLALEGTDADYDVRAVAQGGFHGKLRYIESKGKDKKPRPHEEMLEDMLTQIWDDKEVTAVIFNSLGRLRSRAEEKAHMGEASMGRRAILANQYWRDVEGLLMERDTVANLYVLNHVTKGGMGERLSPGVVIWNTPGGEGIKFSSCARIHLWHKEVIEEGVAYVSRGQVTKLRYGGRGREFYFAMVAGLGVSPGLTALVDCCYLGLAKRESAGVQVMDDHKKMVGVGRIGKYLKAAADCREEIFAPFYAALRVYEEAWVSAWQQEQTQTPAPTDTPPPSKPSRSRRQK